VSKVSAVRDTWRRLRRRWNAWRTQLRRGRASVALFVLLTLGLGEPLMCVIHCQFWLPSALQSYFALQHHHHHHTQTASARPAGAAAITLPAAADSSICFVRSTSGNGTVPFHVPPSPI
jgi:hypothetical protein